MIVSRNHNAMMIVSRTIWILRWSIAFEREDDLSVLEVFWHHEDPSGKLKEGSLAS